MLFELYREVFERYREEPMIFFSPIHNWPWNAHSRLGDLPHNPQARQRETNKFGFEKLAACSRSRSQKETNKTTG